MLSATPAQVHRLRVPGINDHCVGHLQRGVSDHAVGGVFPSCCHHRQQVGRPAAHRPELQDKSPDYSLLLGYETCTP